MGAPTRQADPAGDKRRAIKLAEHAATKFDDAEAGRAAALRFAHEQGASLRELEEATGIPFKTVSRIIGRTDDEPR